MIALLQIDAVDPALVDRLVAEGRMPVLAALLERGTRVPLETTEHYMPAAAYATVYSGLEPGEHAMYYGLQWSAAEQRVRHRLTFEAPDSLWERLARAGQSSLVVDAYETHRQHIVNGTTVGGWQFWNHLGLEPLSAPADARKRLERRFGRARRAEEVFGRTHASTLLALRRRLLPAAERVADAVEFFLGERSYDLVWATFLATHLGGHQFWDMSSLDGDRLSPAQRSTLEGALAELYEAADRAIGRIVAALPDDADVIVLSALGMGPNWSRADLMGDLVAAALAEEGDRGRRASVPLWRFRARVPQQARSLVANVIGGRLTGALTARASFAGVDWSRTRVFVLPSDHHGQLRVNVRGREREGIVDPAEIRPLLEQLTRGLLTFRDDDGTPTVEAVELMDDLVGADAPERDRLPDAIVRWAPRAAKPLRWVESPEFGRVERVGAGNGRSGAHTGEAWALLAPARSRVREPSRPARLVDVAATVFALRGVDAPGLRGEPLLEPT